MAALIAAVVIVGLLGLVNLLFLFGVIRRLREHTEILDNLSQRGPVGRRITAMLDVGDAVADFVAGTVEGEQVSRGDLDGVTLVGVFSPNCAACEGFVGAFVEYAVAHAGGRDRTLAVVAGTEEESASYVERLTAAARVVVEPQDGPLTTALSVRGFPAFALIDDGVVTASGFDLSALPAPVG